MFVAINMLVVSMHYVKPVNLKDLNIETLPTFVIKSPHVHGTGTLY